MKTERLVILVTPQEKKQIHSHAKALNVSTSEVVRQALHRFRPGEAEQEEMLSHLADELEKSTKAARQSLKQTQKELNATLDYFANKQTDLRAASA